MSRLADVTGTGEDSGKEKAPKEGRDRSFRPGHTVKNCMTVI